MEVTSNGEEAWAAVEQCSPELILSDVQMPLLDGLGLLRRVRADARAAGVSFIMMTANNQRELLFAGLEAGMDDFLLKPFHPLELLARLRCQQRMVNLRREAAEQIACKEAEAVSQAKNRFFASLSHELRTPLTPVRLASHLIGKTEGLPASVYEGAETIRRNVEAEACLIDNLLDVCQIENGRLPVKLSPIDLHDCLGQAIRECQQDYVPKGLRLTVGLAAQKHEVMGDADRLREVFCPSAAERGEIYLRPRHGDRAFRQRWQRHLGGSAGHRCRDRYRVLAKGLRAVWAEHAGTEAA